MTNYEKIKEMSINQMALDRIHSYQEYAGARVQWYGDFIGDRDNKEEALKDEIKWLTEEVV